MVGVAFLSGSGVDVADESGYVGSRILLPSFCLPARANTSSSPSSPLLSLVFEPRFYFCSHPRNGESYTRVNWHTTKCRDTPGPCHAVHSSPRVITHPSAKLHPNPRGPLRSPLPLRVQLTLLLYKSAAHGAEFSSRYVQTRFPDSTPSAPRLESIPLRAVPSRATFLLVFFFFHCFGIGGRNAVEKIEIKNGGGASVFLKSSFKGEKGGGEVFRCTKTIPSSRIGLSRGESAGRGGKKLATCVYRKRWLVSIQLPINPSFFCSTS